MHSSLQLYSIEQIRELDRLTAKVLGIESFELMRRAGQAVFAALRKYWPQAGQILVVAGTGNNGGDGYVAARAALDAGVIAHLVVVGAPERIRGDAERARNDFLSTGGLEIAFDGQQLPATEVIVDALFGSGLNKPLMGEALAAVRCMNGHPAPKLAVDIPSGLNGDTGMPMGEAVTADRTISFIGRKKGLYTGFAHDYRGTLAFENLGAREAVYGSMRPSAELIDSKIIDRLLPPRARSAHKGLYGYALVIGGDSGMTGALQMACEAALRVGAGRVAAATHVAHAPLLPLACPPLMSHGVETAGELGRLLDKADVVAAGPGLGTSHWGLKMFGRVLDSGKPLVLDADALNLLAKEPCSRGNWILTPHPAEAARLLGSTAKDVQADRFAAAKEIQKRFGGICVLKGAGSLVQSEARCTVCDAGNPGMATAGMGDVLTGIIAGLLAQGLALREAAELGVYLHARAADEAAQNGERGLIATDLFAPLRKLINPCRIDA
jgi:ADP-dependent NAD(P)H-hydrate dehydratase / NAD(P)H-hydrate epimerase